LDFPAQRKKVTGPSILLGFAFWGWGLVPSIELGQISFVTNMSCLYDVYVRGEAYLAAGQGSAALVEFQKILDHDGIVRNCWMGALAHLGVAHANSSQSMKSQGADADAACVRALAAYKRFPPPLE
jgi:hypothetical protein